MVESPRLINSRPAVAINERASSMQLSVLIHTLLSKRTMAPLRSLSIALALFGLCPDSGWAAISIDVTVSRDQGTASTTPTTGSFSTSAANELLLAFVSTDYRSGTNTTVTGVTGGGLTWVLVRRTNVQKGTTEIWRAFAPTVLTNATVRATLSQSVASRSQSSVSPGWTRLERTAPVRSAPPVPAAAAPGHPQPPW